MPVSEKSESLYRLMLQTGYPKEFADLVVTEMRSDFTAGRMAGYIARVGLVSLEEATDEMLAILSDRDRIAEKHIAEHAQGVINRFYMDGAEQEEY